MQALKIAARRSNPPAVNPSANGMERLIQALQDLAAARDLTGVTAIAARAARDLAGGDGASFVQRDGDRCHYLDEDAIEPLWKGQRFALDRCVTGWAMRHREAVAIEDIYADPRVPADVYRATFVKSLVVVPIRRAAPVGALAAYWAAPTRPSDGQVRQLQAVADATASALERLDQVTALEARLADRAHALAATNRELEAFLYAVSHDLRAPLRAIGGFSQILREDHAAALAPEGQAHLERIVAAAGRMGLLIEDLLELSRVSRGELVRTPLDVAMIARELLGALGRGDPARAVELVLPDALPAEGDPRLVRLILTSLLGNAWKFTGKRGDPRIELGRDGEAFFVRDNGVGFESSRAGQLFVPFQRMHAPTEFEGTGIGLAKAQRAVLRHGGKIWVDARIGAGATFYFTLGTLGTLGSFAGFAAPT